MVAHALIITHARSQHYVGVFGYIPCVIGIFMFNMLTVTTAFHTVSQ